MVGGNIGSHACPLHVSKLVLGQANNNIINILSVPMSILCLYHYFMCVCVNLIHLLNGYTRYTQVVTEIYSAKNSTEGKHLSITVIVCFKPYKTIQVFCRHATMAALILWIF